jgi:hypothetical protein
MAAHLRHLTAVGRRALLVLVAVLASSNALLGVRTAAAVDPCSFANVNPIPCENAQPGTPQSVWSVGGAGDPGIQGFATDISVDVGGTISFKIDTASTGYSLTIYRLGFYQGNGARQIATVLPSAALPQQQPACLTDATTGLIDCGNWAVSASWTVPATAVSGLYFARVADTGTGAASQIWFVVRNDASTSEVIFRTDDTTWEAYNDYGGNSVYYGQAPSSNGRAYKVSYNRPFHNRSEGVGFGTANGPLYAEYPMIKWLESNGYNLSYTSSIDTERFPALLEQHKVFLTAGHDEYWSAGERAAVQAARDAGVSLALFTGNTSFWKIRWESSIDGSNTPFRTLVTYKESLDQRVLDPQDPPTWTGSWRDPRWSPPADGGQPENALIGTIFTVDRGTAAPVITSDFAGLRFWRNTAVAGLTPGQTVTLAPQTIGYEWDEDLDNGSRPAGLLDLSSTTVSVPLKLRDYGVNYQPGTATYSPTMYRAPGGALVFSAGTVQWAWGLDVLGHDTGPDFGPSVADRNMQQATVNLLADMGVQPATPQSGLVAATASTDTTPPTSTLDAPAAGAVVGSGSQVTISGTASDVGGVVAGVEVSADGGTTWHKATGTTTWSYAWTPGAPGPTVLKSRAVDDSGNLENPSAGVTVNVTPPACPCRLFPTTDVPGTPNSQDSNQVEVGVRFTSDVPGAVSGVSFYKGSSNTGSHVGNLWTSTGTLLATGAFTNETASGWQTLTFATPVVIQPNTVYVASYHTTSGFYSSDAGFYTSPVNSWPLHAPAGFNGVFSYGGTQFPTGTFSSNNYWVDVIFNPETTSTALTSSANPSVFGQPVTLTATVTPSSGGGAEPSGTVAFLDGTTQIGTGTLNGGSPDVATLTTALAVGGHSLTAAYGGGGGFLGSTSPALAQQVNRAATATSLTASPSPATFGSTVTLSAAVAPVAPGAGKPTGTVAFFDGTTQLGTAAVAAGGASLSTATLAGGTHALEAVYQGDANFTGSTSAIVNEVVQPAATKLAAAPALLGLNPLSLRLLNLSATLTRGDTGAPIAGQKVTMTAGGTFLCSATTDSAGMATCDGVLGVLAILLNGGYTATFAGTPNYRGSSAFGPAIS